MLGFFEWLQAWIAVIPTIVMLCSFIAAVTPTPIDDGWMKKVYKLVDWFALNVGRAKDKKHFMGIVGCNAHGALRRVNGKKKEKST